MEAAYADDVYCIMCFVRFFPLGSIPPYGACRPPDYWAFSFDCAQNQVTWIQDALFGAITDNGALGNFCEQVAPNRTSECIPQRSIVNRNIRLACNTVRGQCRPEGPNEMIHADTFDSCPQPRSFTYGYAVYDCLPGREVKIITFVM